MNRINKVLLLFLVGIFLTFSLLWSFLQSDTFGHLLSKAMNEYSQQAGIEVNVTKVNFSFFPPGAVLEGVKFAHQIEENSIEAELDRLILELGYWNFWGEKTHFRNIEFNSGTVNLKGPWAQNEQDKKENKSVSFDLTKDFKRFQNIIELLPVKISSLLMKKVNFKAIDNKYQLYLKKLELVSNDNGYDLEINAYPEVPIRSFKKPILIDEIFAKINFDSKDLKIKKVNLLMGGNTLNARGVVRKYLSKDNMELDLKGDIHAELDDLENFINIGTKQVFNEGEADLVFDLKGDISNFFGNISGDVKDLKTSYIHFDDAKIQASFDEHRVYVNKVEGNYQSGSIKVNDRFTFLDFKNKRVLPDTIIISATNFSLGNCLVAVPSLKPLASRFSGKISLASSGSNLEIKSLGSVQYKDLMVRGKTDIIKIHETNTDRLSVSIEKDLVKLDIQFNSPSLIGEFKGEIIPKLGKYDVPNLLIDFSKIELLENKLPISGQGSLKISAVTRPKEQFLNIEGIIDNTKLMNFNLAKLDTKLTFAFHKNKVFFDRLIANYGQDQISGQGEVDYLKSTQDFKLKISKINYKNFVYLIKDYIKDIEMFPENVVTKLSGFFETSGKLEFNEMKIKGRLYASGGDFYDEKFSYGYTDIFLEKGRGLLDNMLIKKSGSDIKGSFSYNFNNKYLNYSYSFEGLPTQNINFFKNYLPNWDSELSAKIEGSQTVNSSFFYEAKLAPSRIFSNEFEESMIVFKSRDKLTSLKGNILGSNIEFDITLNPDERATSSKKESNIILNTNLNKLEDIVVALPRDYLNLSNFAGSLVSKSNVNYNFNDWTKVELKSSIQKVKLLTDQMNLNYESDDIQFSIKNSKIVKWDFLAQGKNITLESKASGNLGSKLEIENKAKFDLSIVSALFRKVQRSSGETNLSLKIKEDYKKWSHEVSLSSPNFSFGTELLPFTFKRGMYNFSLIDQKIIINNFSSQLNEGDVSAKGEIDLEANDPAFNLRYSLRRAGIDLFKKSRIFLSGNGAVLGRNRPYILSGDLVINRSYILDELQDVVDDNQTYTQEVKYLPEGNIQNQTSLTQFNIDLKTDDYVLISNSVTDSKYSLQGNVSGDFSKFYFDGFVRLFGNKNKAYFKGAEYDIRKLDLLISSEREISNPEIDAWASSTISDYQIDIKAYGRKDDLNFSLTSEPNLNQNDIISLVAFGYTNKISNDLSSESREALTRAGIGSFVFDQIGLNKTLKREFGLQLSLGTEFQNDEDLLNQRTGNTVGRVRSATKIEVKKDITDKVDLSLATTVGGNIGETRSMNLNYDLKDNVSIQGVYEIITNEQGDVNRVDNSAGADLKFRWEFK